MAAVAARLLLRSQAVVATSACAALVAGGLCAAPRPPDRRANPIAMQAGAAASAVPSVTEGSIALLFALLSQVAWTMRLQDDLSRVAIGRFAARPTQEPRPEPRAGR